jgi:hypothetical protein
MSADTALIWLASVSAVVLASYGLAKLGSSWPTWKRVGGMGILAVLATVALVDLTVSGAIRPDDARTVPLQAVNNLAIGPLVPDRTLRQEFVAGPGLLWGVRVVLGTYARQNDDDLVFRLYRGEGTDAAIRSVDFSAASVKDNAFHRFVFAPIAMTAPETFVFEIESKRGTPSNALAVWANRDPGSYPEGRFWIGGREEAADAGFSIDYTEPQSILKVLLFFWFSLMFASFLGLLVLSSWWHRRVTWVLDHFYLVTTAVFLLLFAFSINFSSLGMWSTYLASDEAQGSTLERGILWGNPKPIRSDEWLVEFPYFLGQTNSGFSTSNSLGPGQDPRVTLTMPTLSLDQVFSPLTWGFLFLDPDWGLSWFWLLKLYLFFVSSYYFLDLLTSNRRIALFGAFWILLSPAVQWWTSPHFVTVLVYGQMIILSVHAYLFACRRPWTKALFLGVFFVFFGGFLNVLYVPIQVVFGYFVAAVVLILFAQAVRTGRLRVPDCGAILVVLVAAVLLQFDHYRSAWPSYMALSDTIYPGHRVSTGNDVGPDVLVRYLINPVLPFNPEVPQLNQSEASSFFHWIPLALGLFVLAVLQFRRRVGPLVWAVVLFLVAGLYWLYVGLSAPLAKAVLLSYAPGGRALIAVFLAGVYLSVWALSQVRSLPLSRGHQVMLLGFSFVPLISGWANPQFQAYVGLPGLTFLVLVLAAIQWLVMTRRTTLAMVLFTPLLVLSGCFVNPVQLGTGNFSKLELVTTVQELKLLEPESLWVGEGDGSISGQMLVSQGVRTLNGTYVYPALDYWRKLDPEGKFLTAYNRYAHLFVTLDPQPETVTFTSPSLDVCVLKVGINQLGRLGVTRIVSRRNLLPLGSDKFAVEVLREVPTSDYRIYAVGPRDGHSI